MENTIKATITLTEDDVRVCEIIRNFAQEIGDSCIEDVTILNIMDQILNNKEVANEN